MKKIVLIDGNNLCYRAFYAIRSLSTSTGFPTNAVYGMYMMLRKIVAAINPDAVVVCMDSKGPTLRHREFISYKINRKPMPDDLIKQMPYVKKMIELLGMTMMEAQGYEADDIIGSLTKNLTNKNLNIAIVSADKDLLQLIDKNVCIIKDIDQPPLNEEDVKAVYGVLPHFIPDYLALVGDNVDDIPGVPGIGPKAARALILKYGGIESILENVSQIQNKRVRELLSSFREQAIISRRLATLFDIGIDISIDQIILKQPDRQGLFEFFKEMEFRSLLNEHSSETKKEIVAQKVEVSDIKNILEYLLSCSEISIYFVPDIGFAFAGESGKSFFFKIQNIGLYLKIFNSSIPKYGYNTKEVLKFLIKNNVPFSNIVGDLLIETHLLRGNRGASSLQDIALEYLEEKLPTGIEKWQEACFYANIISRAHKKIRTIILERGLEKVLLEIEIPLVSVLARMEHTGVCLDICNLNILGQKVKTAIERIRDHLCKEAGLNFNLNSPKQVSDVLFNRLKLPTKRKTKTGFSTDANVLLELSENSPFVKELLEYREFTKIYSTYVIQLCSSIDTDTGCVHTNFSQTDTATGRLSSFNPNLQNIPIKTDAGCQIRKSFIPRHPDRIFVSADYSQIELRLMAHFSKDENLTLAFSNDVDVHKLTAQIIYQTHDITDSMRRFAKTINFAVIYGMTPYGLSKELKISVDEADRFIRAYFENYKGVKEWIDKIVPTASSDGRIRTLIGRIRYIPEFKSPEPQTRQFAERIAINTPLQGTAAEIIKLAMIKLEAELKKNNIDADIVLQVHDELLLEIAEKDVKDVCAMIKQVMENVIPLRVPLRVDVRVGKNWLEMEEQ